MREFDVVVLGAGAAGEVTAGRLGQNGLTVAIVEQALVGGDCSYYACMPSKALLRPVELANEVRRVPGLEVSPIDSAAVLRRRDEVIHDLDDSSQLPWLEQRGVTLVRGRGRITGELTVGVEGQEPLVARRAVVVATGSTPLVPDIPGLRDAQPWTNKEATTAKAVPARLAILGGGIVGAEMAQAFGALGSHVTLIHRGERLIEREEPFASAQVLDSLHELGVDVRLGVSAKRVARNGSFSLELDDGTSLEADELLVAVGRKPGTSGIGLEELGLPTDRPLQVGDDLRVPGHEWLFAVGDVNGRVQLTHMGKYQGRLVADAILGREVRLRSDGGSSPRVIFTDPQVGAVGLTLADAQATGIRVRHVDVDTGGNAGGSFIGRGAPGTSRIVVDEDRRIIVGATITGS
jgi:pyruvate/2-oxoglutarate dehydrogenase complex dihydrolipoamide dehydrogenase (E3) component